MNAYLIIDIGTGNVRVALVGVDGKIISVERDNVIYHKDEKYKEGLFFEPDFLWSQILQLVKKVISAHKDIRILAVTASSQREGIVILDKDGRAVIGFPNHDHRGRFMEDMIKDKNEVYRITGRYPTSLFSALKLVAYREKYPAEWKQVDCFLSISDWAQYQLTGEKSYEHAQASETILYDVKNKCWSEKLLKVFGLTKDIVPPLYFSGTKLENIKKEYAGSWNIDQDIPVFVGGADTQLAIKSTRPKTEDVVLVSGTTTPIVKVAKDFVLDDKQRSWTNSHLNRGQYILETNCGVTGLNLQRIKDIFYPNDSYEIIEKELDEIRDMNCVANLGSLIADDNDVVTNGGFLFDVPIMTNMTRADFAFATLWDIACSIKKNYDSLLDIRDGDSDYVWGCGGGFQSPHLRKFVAGLIGKKLKIRKGYQQASVSGAAVVCSEALGTREDNDDDVEIIEPEKIEQYDNWYKKWDEMRESLKKQQL